ncbi:MAG: transcription termination factor NusA, partial [Pirellulaceae bacterium]
MNPNEILRIVDSLHREKNIDPEIVFHAIESAMVTAATKQYGEEMEIVVSISRENGTIEAICNGKALDPEEMIGRIGAQTAKQVIIQKIREAERDSLIEEFEEQVGQMINGIVQRNEGSTTTVSLGNVEAILPRSEQIPGESYHPNERIRAVIFDVRPQGSRVRVVLSRTRPQLVQRLFEQEIPEIAEGVITVNAISREPGYRSKVAVSSIDQRVDCVGACVGVRGNRIKNIVDELSNERIDIVRWNEDAKELIMNALQPAEVDEVLLCDMIGRAIVLVRDDQLSLAIGRKGQNVRLASKLCGWDIEIMTEDELDDQIERAVTGFSALDGVTEDLAQRLVEQGYLSYDDLSVIEPDDLMELGELTTEQIDHIVEQAERRAEEAEVAAADERRQRREAERAAALAPPAPAAPPAEPVSSETPVANATEETATEETATEETATEETATEETATEETATEET